MYNMVSIVNTVLYKRNFLRENFHVLTKKYMKKINMGVHGKECSLPFVEGFMEKVAT